MLTPRRRRLLGSLIVLILAAGAVVATTGPAARAADAGAETDDDAKAEADAQAWKVLAGIVADNNRKIAALDADIVAATTRLQELATAITETEAKLAATRAEHDRLEDVIRRRAAYIYRTAHAPSLAFGNIAHARDVTVGTKYAESATRVDTGEVLRLAKLADSLAAYRSQLEEQRAQYETQRQRLRLARDGLAALTDRQRKLLDQAGAIPLMGEPHLSADQVVAWFDSTKRRTQLAPGTTPADLVNLFYEEGRDAKIRPDVAFAQSIIETGSFGHAADNNYSGIGACDSCEGRQPSFPTPREGARGQMQLLRNYADATVRATDLGHPLSTTIWGNDPEAAARTYDAFSHKGRAPTWNLMGAGNWATDPNYAAKVLSVYFDIVAWTARRGS